MDNRTYIQEQLVAKRAEQEDCIYERNTLKEKIREHKLALEMKLDETDTRNRMWRDKMHVLDAIINFLDGTPFPETLFTDYPLYNSGFANSTSSFLETAKELIKKYIMLTDTIINLEFDLYCLPKVSNENEIKLEYPTNKQSEIDAKRDEIEAHLDILHDTLENAWLMSKKLNCQAKINVLEATLKYLSEQINLEELSHIAEANPRHNEYSSNSTTPQLQSAMKLMWNKFSFFDENDDTQARIISIQDAAYQQTLAQNADTILQCIPACELWRFFVDGFSQDILPNLSFIPFTQLYAAFYESFNCDSTLDIQMLKKLDRSVHTGEIRWDDSQILLTKRHASAAGILEIINNHAFYKNHFYLIEYSPTSQYEGPLSFSQQNRSQVAKDTLALITNPLIGPTIAISIEMLAKNLEAALAKILDEYNNAITNCTNPAKKLLIITSFFQKCVQLQPFTSQASSNHFQFLLLNHLLIRNGFVPAILHDLNRFYAHSSKELVNEVIHGMENTITLLKEKNLYGIDTNQQRTDDHQEYFAAADEIESNKGHILKSVLSM